MAAWRQLPLEIRQRILEFVAEIRFPPRLRRYSENPQKVASYACVSREWQQFFEQYTFRTLALTDSDIAAFCLAVEGDMVIRLSYMVQMRLSIRLERYRCAVCTKDEDDNEMERNNAAFSVPFWNCLSALSTWKKPADGRVDLDAGIVLELEIYSPSDNRHTFHDFRRFFHPVEDAPPPPTNDELHAQRCTVTNKRHRRQNGLRTGPPHAAAARRLLGGRLLDLDADSLPDGDIPRLDIVRHFRLSRRFYRTIHPSLLAKFLRACPEVLILRLEQWRPVSVANFEEVERGYDLLLGSQLPKTICALIMYQDSNGTVNHSQNPLSRRRPCRKLGWSLAKASTRLGSVAVSFFVEADNFFEGIDPSAFICTCPGCRGPWLRGLINPKVDLDRDRYQWPYLTDLALTSSTLSPTSSTLQIQELLASACRTAARMPALRTLEIWYAEDNSDHACVFSFRRRRTTTMDKKKVPLRPLLSFCATWNFGPVITPSVVEQWQAICDVDIHSFTTGTWAGGIRPNPIEVWIDLWPRTDKDGNWRDGRTLALDNLVLVDFILNPGSRAAMKWERGEGRDMM